MRRGKPLKRRLCEERIIVFRATSPRQALRYAQRRGASDRLRYRNLRGEPVVFEFIGVLDVLELGGETDQDEVWYEIRERLKPMERRRTVLPKAAELARGARATHSGRKTRNLMFRF